MQQWSAKEIRPLETNWIGAPFNLLNNLGIERIENTWMTRCNNPPIRHDLVIAPPPASIMSVLIEIYEVTLRPLTALASISNAGA